MPRRNQNEMPRGIAARAFELSIPGRSVNGQVAVPGGGQLKVSTPRAD
jgi:hypothetical protein